MWLAAALTVIFVVIVLLLLGTRDQDAARRKDAD